MNIDKLALFITMICVVISIGLNTLWMKAATDHLEQLKNTINNINKEESKTNNLGFIFLATHISVGLITLSVYLAQFAQ